MKLLNCGLKCSRAYVFPCLVFLGAYFLTFASNSFTIKKQLYIYTNKCILT